MLVQADVELMEVCLQDVRRIKITSPPYEGEVLSMMDIHLAIALFNHRVRFLTGNPLAASDTNGSD